MSSIAHGYGIFWMEHTRDGKWVKHVIDDSWSQPHAVMIVDFRNTGNIGLLTGKRYMAHNGHDPGHASRWESIGMSGCSIRLPTQSIGPSM